MPEGYSDLQVAPLLCAGLIGYRALGMTGEAERLGLYGFGSSAHIIAQVARFQGRRVFAFTRSGDEAGQTSARELGAEWAGDSLSAPPEELDAAIIFASAGELVPQALHALAKGGTVVCSPPDRRPARSQPPRVGTAQRAQHYLRSSCHASDNPPYPQAAR